MSDGSDKLFNLSKNSLLDLPQ